MVNINTLVDNTPLAINGKKLEEVVKKETEIRKPIIDSIIYEKSTVMLVGDSGIGKSTIFAQLSVELSCGLPAFGFYHISRPMNVFYIQAERDKLETIERLRKLSKTNTPNYDNFTLTDSYQRLNLLNENHASAFIKCIKRDCPKADIIIIDPIYSLVRGGLANENAGVMLTWVFSMLQKEMGCAIMLGHHPTKSKYEIIDGRKVYKDDPFYGSTFLKAHCTGSYNITGEKNGEGVTLDIKKDNYKNLAKQISLKYDPESGMCFIEGYNQIPSESRILQYLRGQQISNGTFSFYDISTATQLSHASVNRALRDSKFLDYLEVVNMLGRKHIYRVKDTKF